MMAARTEIAAIATVGVQLAMVAIYLAGARAIDGGAAQPPSTRADLAEIMRYGLPVGGHLFAETLAQQNANVARWFAIRRARGQM